MLTSKIKIKLSTIVLAVFLFCYTVACGANPLSDDIRKLDEYCRVIGLADACGVSWEEEMVAIEAWVARIAPETGSEIMVDFIDCVALQSYEQTEKCIVPCDNVHQLMKKTKFPH